MCTQAYNLFINNQGVTSMELMKEELYQNIIEIYLQTGSVKDTANYLQTYPIKVRRVLITEGLWSSRTSEAIGFLWEQGLTVLEIAEELCLSEKNIQSYLPYTRGQYGGTNRSDTAIRSEIYRERMHIAASSQPVRKQNVDTVRKYEESMIMERKEHKPNNVVCLHLELADSGIEGADDPIVKYGKVKKRISRDVLVPEDITLHALHYVILKAFGWQNGHLHSFSLLEDDFQNLTDDSFDKYAKLCGVYFRFPTDDYEDLYWDDDYEEGKSFNTWLRSKYTGPYVYGGERDYYLPNQQEVKRFCEHFRDLNPKKRTLHEITGKVCLEGNPNHLLERLCLRDVLLTEDVQGKDGKKVANICGPNVTPIVHELLYEYDYGDGWEVRIALSDVSYTNEEKEFVFQNYRPLCIAKDGLSVLDDVGGMWGYRDFLVTIHEGREEEQEEMREWARYLGWNGRNISPKNML